MRIVVFHALLNSHQTIAWDMDGTLVDGPNSTFFRQYITATPHKTHHIVTFRDQKWANRIPDELTMVGFDTKHIVKIHPCPSELWLAYVTRDRTPVGHPSLALADEYLHWKGKVAKKLGCTVLIDDMVDHVIKGCIFYGVEFQDANNPSFSRRDHSLAG